ncbi:two-component response regulator-like APRR6 isoform X1 [Olea europaea subsp. europaea]|uniref:Two-component response regulator-like APRR6 isoform X1 n=1 Tax=Olea europaea subsp. europaea TaxID=158383 RepID=A0A8S0V3T2_OLEEU|nr:two-component response regulator-like APRR6 isoform X1 [Olea europaea subsp. europaea]
MNKSEEVISILVVDDDTTCLSIISAILRRWNYEVVTVKHPVDALRTLRIKGGAFHLVVTDVHMPDMNGFELQQTIAQEFKLPVGLMSADDNEDAELKGMENGAAFFLMKPISPDNLRDLWQFADKKKQNQAVIEETYKSSDVIAVSGSSVNEDGHTEQEDTRKNSPIKEGNGKGEGKGKSKKVKVNWTLQLHDRFLEALRSIGLERAVPKRILEVMDVPGLTRENVASHLQKYRIFLKRVSDASYRIQRSAEQNLVSKTLLGSQLSSRNPSVPTISKFSRNKNPRQLFQRSFGELVPSINASFPSQETSSSYLTTPSPTHFNVQSLLTSNGISQSNYQANPSLKGSHQTAALQDLTNGLSSFGDSTLGEGALSNNEISAYQNTGTSNISSASTNFNCTRNYVGYRISDIGPIVESAAHKERGQGSNLLDKSTNFTGKFHCNNSGNSGLLEDDFSWSTVLDEIQDTSSPFLPSDPPILDGVENGENDSAFFQMYDLEGIDILSTQQSVDEVARLFPIPKIRGNSQPGKFLSDV